MAGGFEVEHVQLAELGEEHVANAVYRRGREGDRIVAWGHRVLEWAVAESARTREVVPPIADLNYSNGGCALDVDGDGVDEIVVARGKGRPQAEPELIWLKETTDEATWTSHHIAETGTGNWSAPHDFQPFSVTTPDGRHRRGIVTIIARRQLAWFEIPDDPTQPWARHDITHFADGPRQSGLVVGDVAGNGRPDVVCGMFRAECPADPTREPWTVRRYGTWDENEWGGMAKQALADVDGDGAVEIVTTEAEIPEARFAVHKRDPDDADGVWRCRMIEEGLYCPHTLDTADLDGDGRPDFVVGEMTAGGWDFPMNENPRIYAYLNRGGGDFERSVLYEGLGVHEVKLAPVRPEGQWLLYGADEIQPQKFEGMNTHVSFWTVRHTG